MRNFVRIPAIANLLRHFLLGLGLILCGPAAAQQPPVEPSGLTYVDLVELGMASDMVLQAKIDDQITVPEERAPDVPPHRVRLYLEAVTQSLLSGSAPIGESLAFLTDMDRDADGEEPDLEEQIVLLFARRVEGNPGFIQLVAPGAMQPANPALDARIRAVQTQLLQGERPPFITGVREVMSVPGNLVGESETQIFLETREGAPVSISVLRRPNMAPHWGVSWTDIVDQSARAPEKETLRWYSLACYLPQELPQEAYLQSDRESRIRAQEDYAIVLRELGACSRSI